MADWAVMVHGGAGAIGGRLEAAHREGCAAAVADAVDVLDGDGTAVDAVCAAVRALELNPTFNAGVGAALDEDGLPAHDAAVMRGDDQAYGAVAAVVGVESPIELARRVMLDGRHCLLVGPGALRFAQRIGVPCVDPTRFETDASRAAWQARKARIDVHGWDDMRAAWNPGQGALPDDSRGGTVGAVAIASDGGTAAATSTGGLLMRYAGRVGDSPIAGAGTYADPTVGAMSATGHGESMMRTVFAYAALTAMSGSPTPKAGLSACLDRAEQIGGGRGGAIAVLPDGRMVHARNTPGMGTGWQRRGQAVQTAFFSHEELASV